MRHCVSVASNRNGAAMTTHGLLYTEDDVARFVANRRFLAAVHAYSMDRFPLGEAVVRAAEGQPYVPQSIEIAGYNQVIQEVAERIADGKIFVPQELSQEYSDIYGSAELSAREFYGAQALKFSKLRRPDVKKEAFQFYRQIYDEEDVKDFVENRRILAGIDAYGKGILTLGQMKETLFGDLNANPRDLSFEAFRRLCFDVVPRIQAGTIPIPPGLMEEFPEIYRPSPAEPQ
jgi:hypothetical protein